MTLGYYSVNGFQILLVETPIQPQVSQEGVFSHEHKALLLEVIQDLLHKGAIILQSGEHNRTSPPSSYYRRRMVR